MAISSRVRVNLLPPHGDTVVFDDAVRHIRHGSRFTLAKILAFVKRIVLEEPTLLAEVAAWAFIVGWSYSLLRNHAVNLSPLIADSFQQGPYYPMAIIGASIAAAQLVAMISDSARARALCSFGAAVWLGGLATSLIAADSRVPSGLGYITLSLLCLLAFWRVHPRLLVNLLSSVATSLRSWGNRRT